MKILCIDSGIFVGNCAALAKGGNEVYYHTNSTTSPFPNLTAFAPGTGIEGIKKITELNEINLSDMDMVINMDVGRNDEVLDSSEYNAYDEDIDVTEISENVE